MNAYSILRVVKWATAAAVVALAACSSPEPDDTLTILFTGDVLLDRGVRPVVEKRGMDYVFRSVEPMFKAADAVVINLECPLTDTLSPVGKKYIFRADARWAEDLRRVGVTHAAMANNHTNDQGRHGLVATDYHLTRAGIASLGYGTSYSSQLAPRIIEKGGVSVALFNAILLPIENWSRLDDKPGIAQPAEDELVAVVDEYRRTNPDKHIVAVLHWGVEFLPHPSMRQRRLARRLADAGVDAIIGHHPHVLQPVDTVAGIPVYYSIGNFVFDQHRPQGRRSMVASLTFGRDGLIEADSASVSIEGCCPILR